MPNILPQAMSTAATSWADFIAKTELTPVAPTEHFAQTLQVSRQQMNQQLGDLHQTLIEIRGLTARTGSAQFLQDIQQLAQRMDESALQLSAVWQAINEQVQQQCEQLNYASLQTLQKVTLMATPEDSAKQKLQEITVYCNDVLTKITRLTSRFHWQNLISIMLLTAFTAAITVLYIDDQWPWQIHQQAIQERNTGLSVSKDQLRTIPHV